MENSSQKKKNTYLSFRLNNELFAVDVKYVLEILEKQYITLIPQSPEFLKGVINFRGEVIPVIDTRQKLNMIKRIENSKYVIIVLELYIDDDRIQIGAMVDSVNDVIELTKKDLEEIPKFGFNYNMDYIKSMHNRKGEFIMVLNVENIFAVDEIDIIED